jgi:hypothetical protein
VSEEKVYGSVAGRRPGEEVQVRRSEFKGRQYISIRTWYPGSDGDLLPGKGISLELEQARAILGAFTLAVRD